MTTPGASQDAIAAARQLSAALDQVSRRLGDVQDASEERDAHLARYGRKNRHLVVGTIVSVVLDVILTVVVAVLAIQAHTATTSAAAATQDARSLRASQVAACRLGNQLRASQVQLWIHVAAIASAAPPPHSTPAQVLAQKQRITALLAYVRQDFPQLDCARLYGAERRDRHAR